MEKASDARIVNVERVSNGILVEFNDSQCVIYSTSLLLKMLPAAIKVKDSAPDEDSDSN